MKRIAVLMLLALLMNVTEARPQAGLYGEPPESPEEACMAYSGESSGAAYSCCLSFVRQSCTAYTLLAAYCKTIPVSQVLDECDVTLGKNWQNKCKPFLERQCGMTK